MKMSVFDNTPFTRDRHPCPPVGIEPGIPGRERPQANTLFHAATGVAVFCCSVITLITGKFGAIACGEID